MSLDTPLYTQIKDKVSGDLPITSEDKKTIQTLKNSMTGIANDLPNNLDKLTPQFVREVLLPAVRNLPDGEIIKLHDELKKTRTNTAAKLSDLVGEIREVQVYIPRDGKAFPMSLSDSERLSMGTKSAFKNVAEMAKSVANLRDDAEKEQALVEEIIASAKRSMRKFDAYVIAWDGAQKGNKTAWLGGDKNIGLESATTQSTARNVRNASRADFAAAVNAVVASAKDPSTALPDKQTTGNEGTRLDKLAILASYMSALEAGCDEVLPNLATKQVAKVVNSGLDSVFGSLWDVTAGVAVEHPVSTGFVAFILYKAMRRVPKAAKFLFNAPGAATKWVGSWLAQVPYAGPLGRLVQKTGGGMQLVGDAASKYALSSDYADAHHELPKFTPDSDSYREYRAKTIEKIRAAGAASNLPQALAALQASPEYALMTPDEQQAAEDKLKSQEAARMERQAKEARARESAFRDLSSKYEAGQMSTPEYATRAEDIIAGKRGPWQIPVRTAEGKIQKTATVVRGLKKFGDSIPGVNGKLLTKADSTDAIDAVAKRIKGSSYNSIDAQNVEISFSDEKSRVLYEKFRDQLTKYADMQEWDENDRKAQVKVNRIADVKADIAVKQKAINNKLSELKITPPTIPGPPIMSTDAHGHTTSMSTQTTNPARDALASELNALQSEMKELNKEVRDLSKEVSDIKGKTLNYKPRGGTRVQFVTDITALKWSPTVADSILGIIHEINTHVGSKVLSETFFNPKSLKLDFGNLIKKAWEVLKKG